ncbi:MAG: OmpH family outer membrane protein [Candidatus Zixiibacteriota bacterium]|nr:MAG: OmpH family outer membrane protein [candidate division Zixibacteria bacterium]
MFTFRRVSLLLVFALITFALAVQVSNAQGLKVGFVDDQVIQQRYSGWQRAQEQWEVEARAWDEEAAAKQREIDELIDEYNKQKLILSEEKRREKEAAIRAKQESLDAYTRQIYAPGGTAEQKHAGLLDPLIERLNSAIEAVAVEGDYDVIFTRQSGLGFIKDNFDVTEKVLEYLEKEE